MRTNKARAEHIRASRDHTVILAAFFLSGAAACMYEIVWIRPMTTVLSSNIYVISLVLVAFMLGLAIGSLLVGTMAHRVARPSLWYACIEMLIGLYGLVSLELFTLFPTLFAATAAVSSPVTYYALHFAAIFGVLLVPTVLMGMTFPLIARLHVRKDIGKDIGEVYSANNVGAAIGVLLAGFVLLPLLGVKASLVSVAGLNIIAGSLMLARFNPEALRIVLPISLGLFAILASAGTYSLEGLYSDKGVYGFFRKSVLGDQHVLYYEEGAYGEVAVVESAKGIIRRLLVNGQGSSSTAFSDMRVSTMSAYLPILLKPESRSALVVGFGTGAASSVLGRRMLTKTVEIEPRVVEVAPYFTQINRGVLTNTNHSIVYDDARHYLLKGDERYDVIVNHPLDPFQSFSSLLFTKEFFDIARTTLNTGGLFVQWFPSYDLSPNDFRDFYATFDAAFPYQAVFLTFRKGERPRLVFKDTNNTSFSSSLDVPANGAEWIIVGSEEPIDASLQAFQEHFSTLNSVDTEYLAMTGLVSPETFHDLLFFTEGPIRKYHEGGRMIIDDKPSLEFSTPLNRIFRGGPSNSMTEEIARFLAQ